MKESLLHYIWQNKLFFANELKTKNGVTLEVIDVGKPNSDAGPDFFNAKIKIGDTLWAGNVEIHMQSTDWNKHNHAKDKAYNNVILHVVKFADTDVFNADGKQIPQLELKYPLKIEDIYVDLLQNNNWIPCSDRVKNVQKIVVSDWLNYLLSERLETKIQSIKQYLKQSENNWEEAFYVVLARSFGFGVNSQAFEMLAKSLPVSILYKHKNDLFQLEALLFGQAGLLPDVEDEYVDCLRKEYYFLQKKYALKPLDGSIWKLLRLRPDNFPHVRIAQFATLIFHASKLLSKILEQPELAFIKNIFSYEPSDYWKTHYRFGVESKSRYKVPGSLSVESIIINAVVPFVFCYADTKNNTELKDKALHLLEGLKPEQNSIIRNWTEIGLKALNAYDSQALIQLKNEYCANKKCLRCRIGHKVMTI